MKTPHTTPVETAAAATAGTSPEMASPASIAPAPTSSKAARPRAWKLTTRKAIAFAVSVMCVVATTRMWQGSRHGAETANTQPEPLAASSPSPSVQADGLPAAVTASAPAFANKPRAARAVVESPKQVPPATTKNSSPAEFVTAAVAAVSRTAESGATAVDHDQIPSASTDESNVPRDSITDAPVTITGCLETTVDEDRFRLTDTEGIDAPTSRSWRSGFLRKRPAAVELVELSDRSGLRQYLGHRVTVTGLLTSRELHVRSLQLAGVSCN